MDHEKGFWTSTAGMLTAIGGLVGAIAAVLTALVATGTIGGSTSAASERTSYPSAAITVVSASSDYPEVVRNNFVNSCTGAGSPASTCNCALSLIERTVSLADFEKAERDYEQNGSFSDPDVQLAVADATATCR